MAEPVSGFTLAAVLGTLMLQCFQQMRYSRCSKISCCGLELEREVIDLPEAETNHT